MASCKNHDTQIHSSTTHLHTCFSDNPTFVEDSPTKCIYGSKSLPEEVPGAELPALQSIYVSTCSYTHTHLFMYVSLYTYPSLYVCICLPSLYVCICLSFLFPFFIISVSNFYVVDCSDVQMEGDQLSPGEVCGALLDINFHQEGYAVPFHTYVISDSLIYIWGGSTTTACNTSSLCGTLLSHGEGRRMQKVLVTLV